MGETKQELIEKIKKLVEAAKPFLDSDTVDETCGIIPLMDRLEAAIKDIQEGILWV